MAKMESDFIGVFGLFLGKNPNHLEKIRIIWKKSESFGNVFWGVSWKKSESFGKIKKYIPYNKKI